jgi:iron(III) transport system permease protein
MTQEPVARVEAPDRPAAGTIWFGRVGDHLDGFLGSDWLPMLLAWPALGLTLLLSLFVLFMTFLPGLPTEPSFTLANWARLADPYLYAKVLPNTAVVGVGTVLVSLLFAAPLAWLIGRTTLPFQRTIITLIALVAIIPSFVEAMGWLLLFHGRIGLVNRILVDTLGLASPPIDISSSPLGAAWIMGLGLAPTMFFLLAGPMQALDPTLEEAALASGASRWRTFWRISLPLVWPAVLGGAVYTFMTAISLFEIPALLGGSGGQTPVLATELFYAFEPATFTTAPAYGAAGVYGVLIALPSLVALVFYLRVIAESQRYETITGRGYRPQRIDLGRFNWLGVGFVGLYLLMAVVMPLLALVWTSLLPSLRLPSADALGLLSLKNYLAFVDLMGGPYVISNTVALVVSTAALTVLCSFMISWVVVRTRFRIRKAMDILAMLPHAIPGMAFAFALAMLAIVAWRWLPFPLKGTVTIIVLANLINRLAYGTRVTNAALLQVARELEESAWLSGAGTATTMARIVAPLVLPSLLYAGLWTAMLTLREVSMALMLQEADNTVVATRIWTLWRVGQVTDASAAAVVMIATLGTLILLAQLLVGSRLAEPPARR